MLSKQNAALPQDGLVSAVEGVGFEAKLLGSGDTSSLRLRIGGMTCSSCSTAIEHALRATPGVDAASVSLLTNTAEVCRLFLLDCASLRPLHG